jgi:hypothetical protein
MKEKINMQLAISNMQHIFGNTQYAISNKQFVNGFHCEDAKVSEAISSQSNFNIKTILLFVISIFIVACGNNKTEEKVVETANPAMVTLTN